jgi:N-acetylmuramoyl-L-alanine amidase
VTRAGIAYLGILLVLGLTAFRVQVGAETEPELRLADATTETLEQPTAAPADARAEAQLAPDPVPEVAPMETPDVAPADITPAPEPRSRRSRWRNRYPGPIPTPADWAPPEGPTRIALQAGHWRADEAPDELRGLRDNGTRWQNVPEWEANLRIAEHASELLEELGYEVDVLPAVVPPGYRAHLFIAIHADGSGDSRASGYRVASPRFDTTGRASSIAQLLQDSYGEATGLRRLPDVTRRMENYYAFNFRRYEHALHPMTIAVILETGFLTSASDRGVILDEPERAARGIVDAVTRFPVTPPPIAATGTD